MSVDIDNLALAIRGMTYGDLMRVAQDMVTMLQAPDEQPASRHLKTTNDVADLLYDWAESKVEDHDDGKT